MFFFNNTYNVKTFRFRELFETEYSDTQIHSIIDRNTLNQCVCVCVCVLKQRGK